MCQPFGEKHGDGLGTSAEGNYQLLWAQGIFRPRGMTEQFGLDFIAENIGVPTTTLHYPTMRQFIREIKKGYQYIGIAFVSATMLKLIPMVEAIRYHAPSSKIILGGYGTAVDDVDLSQYGDYICREEGTAFIRRLLGEPEDGPMEQPRITQRQSLFSLPLLGKSGYLFAGLGCSGRCDFCATSAFFKGRAIRLLPDGRSILRAIEGLRQDHPTLVNFCIFDEDLLLKRSRGQEFLESIRASNLPALSLQIFASVKAISQFKATELVEMGVDKVWIGFEGKRADYAKMNGRSYGELFSDLNRHGISVMASMIIGFEYQTPEIIQQEFKELMALRPQMTQVLIYSPSYMSPLRERLKKEERLLPVKNEDRPTHDGFYLLFEHPHIGQEEMTRIHRDLCHREFQILGPSIFRVAEACLQGYVNLRDHPLPRVRAKAQMYGALAHSTMMLLPASKRYLNNGVNAWLDNFHCRAAMETGELKLGERALSRIAPAFIWATDFRQRHDLWQQPRFKRRTYW